MSRTRPASSWAEGPRSGSVVMRSSVRDRRDSTSAVARVHQHGAQLLERRVAIARAVVAFLGVGREVVELPFLRRGGLAAVPRRAPDGVLPVCEPLVVVVELPERGATVAVGK